MISAVAATMPAAVLGDEVGVGGGLMDGGDHDLIAEIRATCVRGKRRGLPFTLGIATES